MVLQTIQAGADFETSLAEGVAALKNLSPKSTDQERYVFARWCIANELDPWKSEAFLIVRGEGDRRSVTHQIAYEILLQRAEGTEGYGGFEAGIVVMNRETKTMEDLPGSLYSPEAHELVGAWCKVYRSDRKTPEVRVSLAEFEQTRWDRDTNKRVPMARWATAPASQIMKCAIAEGHRRAFQPARREDVRFEALEASITEEEPEALPAAPEDTPAAGLYEESEAATARVVDESTGEILDVEAARQQPVAKSATSRQPASQPKGPSLGEPKGFANLGDLLNYYGKQMGMDRHQVEEVTGPLLPTSDLQEAQAKLKKALEPASEPEDGSDLFPPEEQA